MADTDPLLAGHVIARLSAPGIIARLAADRANAGADPILAFDADGTIWDGDVGFDLFEAVLRERLLRPAARAALAAEAAELDLPDEGDANDLGAALYGAFNADRYAADRAFAMMAWAFAGWHSDELDAFSARVVEAQKLGARIRAAVASIVAWARADGLDVYVVSASPLSIVRAGAAKLGIPPEHVLAMTPAMDADGVVVPAIVQPVVYGGGKLTALEQARPDATLLGAFGDSDYDAPMLRAARVRVAVEPTARLLRLGQTIANLVILER